MLLFIVFPAQAGIQHLANSLASISLLVSVVLVLLSFSQLVGVHQLVYKRQIGAAVISTISLLRKHRLRFSTFLLPLS